VRSWPTIVPRKSAMIWADLRRCAFTRQRTGPLDGSGRM
jgi:hypothetical protein